MTTITANPGTPATVELTFSDGTLIISGFPEDDVTLEGLAVFDRRIGRFRAHAHRYAEILRRLHGKRAYLDKARAYPSLEIIEHAPRAMRPYQSQALAAWEAARRRGVVVLPTGAGKSYVALQAIMACQRGALILAPTIDLVQQWANDLSGRLNQPVGRYGGGDKDLQAITVSTYDSGALIMPHHGARFGLIVFDECHHLPAPATSLCATACLAPFRLGLTATPERADGGHGLLEELVGPIVFRTEIDELEGNFLANYQVEVLHVPLDPDEQEAYQRYRAEYTAFARRSGVDFSRPDGWQMFLSAAGRDPAGRAALRAHAEQKRLSRASRAKLRTVWDLLRDHHGERCIIFTDDNDTAYRLGSDLFLPVLTHHTKAGERAWMLAGFRSGELSVLVTSRVLNEGVDVPEASMGIVVSGTGSVREHVQRLGRILRPGPGKVAILYELLSAGTAEQWTSDRRRRHTAFGEPMAWAAGDE